MSKLSALPAIFIYCKDDLKMQIPSLLCKTSSINNFSLFFNKSEFLTKGLQGSLHDLILSTLLIRNSSLTSPSVLNLPTYLLLFFKFYFIY